MYLPYYLAELGAQRILERGQQVSGAIAETWRQQWLTVFQSSLYFSIVQLAYFFAIFAVIFYVISFLRRIILEDDWASGLQSLIIPVFILLLLANNGRILGNLTLAMRSTIHSTSQQILSQTLLGVKLEEAIQASVGKATLSNQIGALLSQCQGMVGQKQVTCLEAANKQATELVNAYEQRFLGIPNAFQGYQRYLQGMLENMPLLQAGSDTAGELGEIVSNNPLDLLNNNIGSIFLGNLGEAAAGAFGNANQALIEFVLLGFQWAFANILEISMLLTGLVGPLAVAGGFLMDAKPIWVWLIGFYSLGLAQICYNIIVGLAAVVVTNADSTDTMGFLVLVALLAPAIALAVAAGGGMAVFQVVNSGAFGAIQAVATLGSNFKFGGGFRPGRR